MCKSIINIEISGKTVYPNISRFLGLFVSTKILFSENLSSLKLMIVRSTLFRLDQIGTEKFSLFQSEMAESNNESHWFKIITFDFFKLHLKESSRILENTVCSRSTLETGFVICVTSQGTFLAEHMIAYSHNRFGEVLLANRTGSKILVLMFWVNFVIWFFAISTTLLFL